MSQSPTFSQIRAQVAAIRSHKNYAHAKTIGIRAAGRWTGDAHRQDGDETYSIHQCDSPLAMRIALREGSEDVTKILITDLDERDLGDDILLRLRPRKLVPLDSWQIVKSLFHARMIDPRLTRHSWIAELLMDVIPPGGYSPASGGFLDAETVWPILLGSGLGLGTPGNSLPDISGLLYWSTNPDNVARFRSAPSHFRDAALTWLAETTGAAAELILACVLKSEEPNAVAVGLAATVIYDPLAAGKLEKAAGRFEARFLGGRTPSARTISNWCDEAVTVVHDLIADARERRRLLQRADEILTEVEAQEMAHLSSSSLLGFEQRLARFGEVLDHVLESPAISSVETLTDARRTIFQHRQAVLEPSRVAQLDMAIRLVRWLAHQQEDSVEPQSFAQAAQYHLDEGGYVDWARYVLRRGENQRGLSASYGRLWKRVFQIRELQSQQFAVALQDWTSAGSTGDEVVPVERFLDQVVAPLAAERPILLIILDGMSAAVSNELVADITRQDWTVMCVTGRTTSRPALATIPSVTEVSRTSLFCGELRQGTAQTEDKAFAQQAALVSHSRSGFPPVVFHKVDLQDQQDSSLASKIRDEISDSRRQVVAAVINAVDDHLLKAQQLHINWTCDTIKTLSPLLHEAQQAERLVVLASDHGHVLDHGTTMPCEGKERWRAADGPPKDYELLMEGSRVMLAEGQNLIAPWTESVRYSRGTRNGYHGGATPQEMVIPVTVLSAGQEPPEGWSETPLETPIWWDDAATDVAPAPVVKLKPVEVKEKGVLFNIHEPPEPEPVEVADPKTGEAQTVPDWIAALQASPLLVEQKQLAGRKVPTDEVLINILVAVDRHGGKLTVNALARAIRMPPLRLPGLMVIIQRILNIDGYAVMQIDDSSETVELDRALLCRQFDLVEE